jgi:cytochrome c peroxidase
MRRRLLSAFVAAASLAAVLTAGAAFWRPEWSAAEVEQIRSLSLASLPALHADASNHVADDPRAAALGNALFFDPRLSADGTIACASCHQPDRQFQDGLPVGHGMADGSRRTMPIAGTARLPFLFWDGRKDSQWAQALGPIENPVEHGADRTMAVRLIATAYRQDYERLFGLLPDVDGLPTHAMPNGTDAVTQAWAALTSTQQGEVNRVFANLGKAIAAYERTIEPQPTRFDAYAVALSAGDTQTAGQIFSADERSGLRLFLGKGNCVSCHNGPLLTDGAFHNLGLPNADPVHDAGRSAAAAEVQADPFNCLGAYSDARPSACPELKFIETSSADLVGAFRSPSLRGVAERAPFMHAGQFGSLDALLDHYNKAPPAAFGRSELKPLGLSDGELGQLRAFLAALSMEVARD